MNRGSKYTPLLKYLHESSQDELTLSFSKIETLIRSPLPNSAHISRAWWSNRRSGGFQSRYWLDTGYRVINVDLDGERVTFRKQLVKHKSQQIGDAVVWDSIMIEALRYHMKLSQTQFAAEIGVRQQTVSEWERGVYQPKRSMSKLLTMIADREKFRYE